MLRYLIAVAGLSLMAAGAPSIASGQGRPDSAALIAAQREAMGRFAVMDGVWRGSAWTMLPSGEKHNITQTERVGPFLDGSVKVIEGRGYGGDGSVDFNALAIISYDLETRAYNMRSYAQGHVGDFVLTPTVDGFEWEMRAGSMTMRYTAVIRDGTWREVGDRILPDKEPIRFFEMTLTRVGDTNWPAAGAVTATNVVDAATIDEDADEQTDTEFEIEVSYGREATSGALSYDCSNGESNLGCD